MAKSTHPSKKPASSCPCGGNMPYHACCEPYHKGEAHAPTAEALMRSRYVAYTQCNAQYLEQSWHPSTCPSPLQLHPDTNPQWIRLEIKEHIEHDHHATVTFIAHYKVNGKAQRLHENSRFIKENGLWFYVDGDML